MIRLNVSSRIPVLKSHNLAHQFWFSYPPHASGTSRSQADEEKKEKKEVAEVSLRAELFKQQEPFVILAKGNEEPIADGRNIYVDYNYVDNICDSHKHIIQSSEVEPQMSSSKVIIPFSRDKRINANSQTSPGKGGSSSCRNVFWNNVDLYGTASKSRDHSHHIHNATASDIIQYHNLGKSGLRISNIGLATWSIFSDNVSIEQAEEVITFAYDAGINVFDVSEMYSSKKCESTMGQILKNKMWDRSTFVIVTKIYWRSNKFRDGGLSRKHIVESLQQKLKNLQLEYVDIILIHKLDPLCPTEEVIRAMDYVINRGLAMYWGTANWSSHEIMTAYSNCRQFNCVIPITEQCEYHMFYRERTELFMPEMYNKVGAGLMVWSPVSTGMLSNDNFTKMLSNKNKSIPVKWCDDATRFTTVEVAARRLRNNHQMQVDEFKTQLEKLHCIAELAKRMECSLVQLGIGWCLKNEYVQCVLIGANTIYQLCHILESVKIVKKLSPNVMNEIESILDNKPGRQPTASTLTSRSQ